MRWGHGQRWRYNGRIQEGNCRLKFGHHWRAGACFCSGCRMPPIVDVAAEKTVAAVVG